MSDKSEDAQEKQVVPNGNQHTEQEENRVREGTYSEAPRSR